MDAAAARRHSMSSKETVSKNDKLWTIIHGTSDLRLKLLLTESYNQVFDLEKASQGQEGQNNAIGGCD